jgi:ABC-2 type transport system permease protein
MNIFLRELRANLKSLVIWSVIVLLFVTVGFSKFTAYEGNPDLLAILDNIPPAVMQAFSFNAFNLTTITGFFGVMFTYFALLLSVAAAMWGSDIITKEERDKTVEYALTLPVSRSRLVTGKLLAALVLCLVLLLVTWAGVLVNSAAYQTNTAFYEFVMRSMLALGILQVIFLAIGVFLGCALKRYRRAGSLAVAILLSTYFVSVISGMMEELDFLKYFSPFKYFSPAALLNGPGFEGVFLLLSAAIVVVCLAGAYVTYNRRDLYI